MKETQVAIKGNGFDGGSYMFPYKPGETLRDLKERIETGDLEVSKRLRAEKRCIMNFSCMYAHLVLDTLISSLPLTAEVSLSLIPIPDNVKFVAVEDPVYYGDLVDVDDWDFIGGPPEANGSSTTIHLQDVEPFDDLTNAYHAELAGGEVVVGGGSGKEPPESNELNRLLLVAAQAAVALSCIYFCSSTGFGSALDKFSPKVCLGVALVGAILGYGAASMGGAQGK